MAGFLDKYAPSIEAEYSRYLEGDILGKIIFKNFLLHIVELPERYFHIPISRCGDLEGQKCIADAQINLGRRYFDIEIKFARLNVYKGHNRVMPNWAFSRLLKTKRGRPKHYDFVFAAGLNSFGLEFPGYWSDLTKQKRDHRLNGHPFEISALPHEPEFLARCGIFLIPISEIRHNDIRHCISRISTCRYSPFFSWGHDVKRLRAIWSTLTKHRPPHSVTNRFDCPQ